MKHVENLYQNSFYYFKAIDPIKKYNSFTFTELPTFDDVLPCHCEKGEIVKVGKIYFEFHKTTTANLSHPQKALIIFKDKKGTVAITVI